MLRWAFHLGLDTEGSCGRTHDARLFLLLDGDRGGYDHIAEAVGRPVKVLGTFGYNTRLEISRLEISRKLDGTLSYPTGRWEMIHG
jgi:hypothetical protein